MLEPEPEPKNLDAWNWSQNRSLQFAFRLHSPAFGSLQPAGYERLLESHGRRQKDSQPKRANESVVKEKSFGRKRNQQL